VIRGATPAPNGIAPTSLRTRRECWGMWRERLMYRRGRWPAFKPKRAQAVKWRGVTSVNVV
jgi:hypothetical protein